MYHTAILAAAAPGSGSSGASAPPVDGPHAIDRHVGLRLRARRKALGVSQERLAELVGLTFQQVQKYERAANRISASRLWEIARALDTSVTYFFEDLDDEGHSPVNATEGVSTFLLSHEGSELAKSFLNVPAPVRRRILSLVRSLAEAESEATQAEPERVD